MSLLKVDTMSADTLIFLVLLCNQNEDYVGNLDILNLLLKFINRADLND